MLKDEQDTEIVNFIFTKFYKIMEKLEKILLCQKNLTPISFLFKPYY